MTPSDERGGAAGESRRRRVMRELQVSPGSPAGLADRGTGWTGGAEFSALSGDELSATARDLLARGVRELRHAQERLWAGGSHALLVVFQAIDAAGKDSTIKHVMSGVNPQGVQVVSFRRPSAEELGHDFLWRISRALPERGRIGIFNRSHYEEVIGVRVHPEWLAAQKLPPGAREADLWTSRYEDINAFERHLDRTGTAILKLFLNVSRDEQKRRFLARLDQPGKQWKFNAADVDERERWPAYQQAYEDALTATSTPWAPWYVVPADRKPVMQAMVAALVVDRIQSLDLSWPEVSEEARAANAAARRRLLAESEDEPGHAGHGQRAARL
jgi:PPK2 family polyphosphate:nucleotide phosphotransferase